MPRRVAVVLTALVVVSLAGAWAVRTLLGFDLSTQTLHSLVDGLGWKAPALFLGLLTFRQFLFLPAMVILPVGGLCFGAAGGTLLGATGIVLSALITFTIARTIGGGWLHETFGPRYGWIERQIERSGATLVALVTAHPTGPMAAFFWGAGFSSMALLPFVLAVAGGGAFRALAYAFFGSTLLAPGSPSFYLAVTLLGVAALAPFAHPGLRRRLLGLRAERPRAAV